MTEQLLPPPEQGPDQAVVAPTPSQRNPMPWLFGLGFLILAVAIFYLWQYPTVPADLAADTSSIHLIQQRLGDIDFRLTRMEQRPPDELGKITARLDALEGRIVDQTQLASRLDILSGRIESLLGRDQTGLDATKQQIDALSSRIAAVEASSGSVDVVAKRLNRIAKLQEASFALTAGRPIGDLPGAPQALERYAHTAPPTEAQLRLRFPRDAKAALTAKQPDEMNAPLIDRAWERAQSLITIHRGNDVVVGNEAAITLTRAQSALDAGDLVGAVSAVEALEGEPAQKMANWLADAKSLLSARSALAVMAEQT